MRRELASAKSATEIQLPGNTSAWSLPHASIFSKAEISLLPWPSYRIAPTTKRLKTYVDGSVVSNTYTRLHCQREIIKHWRSSLSAFWLISSKSQLFNTIGHPIFIKLYRLRVLFKYFKPHLWPKLFFSLHGKAIWSCALIFWGSFIWSRRVSPHVLYHRRVCMIFIISLVCHLLSIWTKSV